MPPEPAFKVHSTSAGDAPPRRIVSVSLGSSSRDHVARTTLLGQAWQLERYGTNGSLVAARDMIRDLDGKVAAIGLGGIDISLVAGDKRYFMKDGVALAALAKHTPIVDGSGLKDTLERQTVQRLQEMGSINWPSSKVLLTCAVDRFGMAEELVQQGARVTFGDFLFILGLPIPLKSLKAVRNLARIILPLACRLPFRWLYPTGEKQNHILVSPRHQSFYDAADVIAGDFLLIKRYLPADLTGKVFLTNTVTATDLDLLFQRGVKQVITTTPEFEGRSFGTNVLEGIFAAVGAHSSLQYSKLLAELNWTPRIINPPVQAGTP